MSAGALPDWLVEACPPSEQVIRYMAAGNLRAAAERWQLELIAYQMGITPVEYQRRYMPPEKRARLDKRVVYVVAETERPQVGDLVKIGTSVDIKRRLGQLRSSSPQPVHLIATVEGGLRRERQLHKRFAGSRQHGEWFRVTPELSQYLEECA